MQDSDQQDVTHLYVSFSLERSGKLFPKNFRTKYLRKRTSRCEVEPSPPPLHLSGSRINLRTF